VADSVSSAIGILIRGEKGIAEQLRGGLGGVICEHQKLIEMCSVDQHPRDSDNCCKIA